MNKAQREPWLALTKVDLPPPFDGNMGLCHFCRYAKWTGNCQESDLECDHPLPQISGEYGQDPADVWGGMDCWGFRPRYALSDAADVVGLFLQGKWPDWGSIERPRVAPKETA